ncbi:mycothiol synthase [Jatrophihabitans endophyticus]|uniref:mycothiol synthase n=1 Tax=Jatrophihabitans endophyticus TaxID=1206085 RepID=UPI0019E63F94|nr:mycothiol synthase [Jatrophihabitans endophyticus]MBE7188316.1 mycothiol synthase [Jatrophihabitans endophyticus]
MPITVSSGTPDRAAVLDLAERVEAEDGAPPLSDQTLAQLGDAAAAEWAATESDGAGAGVLVGYAQAADGVLEIAARRDAVDALLDAAGTGDSVWSHGHASRLVAVLEGRGYRRARELHQLRRPLESDLPADPPLADGVSVRTFVPGQDDAAWLALNAAAFADHPEQGRWDEHDLQARIAEPWFDADGFLLAERDGALVGFHWTKVHPDGWGEVYVLGVAPDGQGLGLGGALLVRGLRDLAERRNCRGVLLYVDGDNPRAMHLYERDGFTRHDLDIQWAPPAG